MLYISGKVLTCVSGNEVFSNVNRSSTLNVYYLPVVHVELETARSHLDPNYIVEGDTISFKCLIQAHPWVWRIVWYRDGEKLVPSDGVVIEEQRLTLKNATKKMSGQYICSAANVEGDGFRLVNLFLLLFMCVPNVMFHPFTTIFCH